MHLNVKVTLFLGMCILTEQRRCIHKGNLIPHHFFVDERELNITIGQSNRLGHQLVSEIFKILVTDVIGYPNVQLKLIEEKGNKNSKALSRTSTCNNPGSCKRAKTNIPEAMINLEVWQKLGEVRNGWISAFEMENCGPLGPVGRSGWLIPTYSVEQMWKTNRAVLDHWRAFRDQKLASLFDLFEGDNMFASLTFDPKLNNTLCSDDLCDEDGIFRPAQCRKPYVRCATLLADFPGQSTKKLIKTIGELNLLVNIAWVGKNLEKIVISRTKELKNVLFFYKTPGAPISLRNFTYVSFKECQRSHCETTVFQIQKFGWNELIVNAPSIHYLLKKFYFPGGDYENLSKTYLEQSLSGWNVEDVACSWVKEYRHKWLNWMPAAFEKIATLYIGGIFPLTGTYWKQASVVHAAEMAINAVNRNATLLPNYQLDLLVQDGQCVADEVMKSFIHYVSNSTFHSMIGILGPACTDTVESISGIAKHYNTIIMSYSAEGTVFLNRRMNPYFYRTVPENKQFLSVYLKIFQELNWNRIAALTEQGRGYSEYVSHLQVLLPSNGVRFLTNNRIPRSMSDIHFYLQDLKDKNARIIIGEFYDYSARAVMCAAYKLGMTASQGYQWFLPYWFNPNWYDTDRTNLNSKLEYVPCTTRQMIDAIEGHLSLAFRPYANLDDVMQENKTVGEWMETYRTLVLKEKEQISQYGGYAYDAVWTYASALDSLLKENHTHAATLHSKKTLKRFAELINATRFSGVSGHLQFIGSSRLSDVIIWQMKNAKKRPIGIYYPWSESNGSLALNVTEILWMTSNRKKPGDGSAGLTSCGLEIFNGVFNNCEVATGVILVVVITVVLSLVIFGVMYYKRRYDKRIRTTEARMKQLGLTTNSRVLALDEWEMPRTNVVINRRLGEGAFGTVYGGEACDEHMGWIGVAVKTLKVGAKPEEKLEFLSEAELMKKLSHPNIIRLVGVCTTVEPIYLVMEFMLYGDLKTYLLERRHLVTSPNRTSDEDISDRRLTQMALDIALGLNYLSIRKYVHRDLACRNCLVNSSRCVKIADFGLCRKIYDSDYYRIRRNRLLPIRWMAPESITEGRYTTLSDIWSFGVVLFEIITFGSFPYQGLSDKEVINFVSSCQTLNMPNGCKPELESLLRKCWSPIPTDRPNTKGIIEVLSRSPDLIWPCLDEPAASVQMDHNDPHSLSTRDSLPWLWRSKRHHSSSMSADFATGLPSPYQQSATNMTKADMVAEIEMKSACRDSSHSSYMFMGALTVPSRDSNMADAFTLSCLCQVTHL